MVLSSAEVQAMVYQLLDQWNREDYREPFNMNTVIGFNFDKMMQADRMRDKEAHDLLRRINQLREAKPEGQKKYVE